MVKKKVIVPTMVMPRIRWMRSLPAILAFLLGCSASGDGYKPGPDPTTTGGSTASQAGATTGGGGSGVGSASQFVSGSRLKLRMLRGDDGSAQVAGWYDSKLGVQCYAGVAGDGVTRCLPSGATAASYFSDAACTVRLAQAIKGCTPSTYATVADVGSCAVATRTRFFHVGAKIQSDIYIGTTDICSKITTDLGTDQYSLGSEVSPTEFVALTETFE